MASIGTMRARTPLLGHRCTGRCARMQVGAFLKEHEIFDYSAADFEQERETLRESPNERGSALRSASRWSSGGYLNHQLPCSDLTREILPLLYPATRQSNFNVRLRLLMFAPRFEQLKCIRHSNRSASQSSASGMTCGWYERRRRNALPQMRQS